MKNNADASFTMTFTNLGDLKTGFGKTHEEVGDISLFRASESGFSTLTKAVVTTSKGAQDPIDLVFDKAGEKTDICKIPLAGKKFTFWDIVKIDIIKA